MGRWGIDFKAAHHALRSIQHSLPKALPQIILLSFWMPWFFSSLLFMFTHFSMFTSSPDFLRIFFYDISMGIRSINLLIAIRIARETNLDVRRILASEIMKMRNGEARNKKNAQNMTEKEERERERGGGEDENANKKIEHIWGFLEASIPFVFFPVCCFRRYTHFNL